MLHIYYQYISPSYIGPVFDTTRCISKVINNNSFRDSISFIVQCRYITVSYKGIQRSDLASRMLRRCLHAPLRCSSRLVDQLLSDEFIGAGLALTFRLTPSSFSRYGCEPSPDNGSSTNLLFSCVINLCKLSSHCFASEQHASCVRRMYHYMK